MNYNIYMLGNSIAAMVKRLREERGLTKYRLAKLSGLDEAYIGQLEAGRIAHPRMDTIAALAEGLKVPPCIFFGGDLEDLDIILFTHGEMSGLDSENKELLRHSINIVRERIKEKEKYNAEEE